ncbi:MAG: PLP-dependent aminotransferase family protein [Rhodospirillaceae bacterium]|nr:PLP-dependent aminotransferase family protein [Rhodospirillaceae bacterium]
MKAREKNRSSRQKREGQTKWADLLDVKIDPRLSVSIARQIYQQLQEAIISTTLPAGSRLPSTRKFSERIRVSRTSVVAAYSELLAEGYIEGRRGSGTFIAAQLPSLARSRSNFVMIDEGAAGRRLSELGARYRGMAGDAAALSDQPFSAGRCSIDLPTIEAWRQISARHARSIPTDVLGYGDPFGRESFREVIAEYLRAFRSVNCTAGQIIVTSGAQQAIDLSLRVLLNPGEPVWVENPGYPALQNALRAANSIMIPVPVDERGIVVDVGLEKEPRPRAIFVTPSHQYPTGAVMAIERRRELLQAAAKADAWILEDDYDSEFRYAGHPLPSLQGLDRSSRVIYIGTLSKVLFPGLRTGFAVIPLDLVDAYRGARYLSDRGPPIAHQGVLEEFMREGFFTSHIRRMRQHYRTVLETVIADLRAALGSLAVIKMPECGMRFVAYLADGLDDVAVARAAARRGVVVRPISPLYLDGIGQAGIDIGFTGFNPRLMQIAAVRLGEAVREVAAGLQGIPIEARRPRP